MKPEYLSTLKQQMLEELCVRDRGVRVAIVGRSLAVSDLEAELLKLGQHCNYLGSFDLTVHPQNSFDAQSLGRKMPDVVVIADEQGRDALVEAVAASIEPPVRILVAGFGHFADSSRGIHTFNDDRNVPVFANGYPNSLISTFQSMDRAARAQRHVVDVQFGEFEGGTTMLVSRFISHLGIGWNVFGFDTSNSFLTRRSLFNTYNHPECSYLSRSSVEHAFEERHAGAVASDVTATILKLKSEQLTPQDTGIGNHTASRTVFDSIADRVQADGQIVFDHWSVKDRFLYTIGSRKAAKKLVVDPRYFNLHHTGVFLSIT